MAVLYPPDIEGLSGPKLALLKIAASHADRVEKRYAPKQRSMWKFIFDDGVFKGQYEIEIRHDRLTPLAVLNMLDSVDWPGFKTIVGEANTKILEVLTGMQCDCQLGETCDICNPPPKAYP